jgi:hypothetical protein
VEEFAVMGGIQSELLHGQSGLIVPQYFREQIFGVDASLYEEEWTNAFDEGERFALAQSLFQLCG